YAANNPANVIDPSGLCDSLNPWCGDVPFGDYGSGASGGNWTPGDPHDYPADWQCPSGPCGQGPPFPAGVSSNSPGALPDDSRGPRGVPGAPPAVLLPGAVGYTDGTLTRIVSFELNRERTFLGTVAHNLWDMALGSFPPYAAFRGIQSDIDGLK